MGSPARSDSVADCGGSDHAPCPMPRPLSQPLQRGIEDRPWQSAALGTCSCQGVLSWLFGSDVFRGRLALPLVCMSSRLNCDGCTSWHVRTAPDASKDGGGMGRGGVVLRGILFLQRQIGEKKQAGRWRSAPIINLSKTDVRTGLVGLKVDGCGGGRVLGAANAIGRKSEAEILKQPSTGGQRKKLCRWPFPLG